MSGASVTLTATPSGTETISWSGGGCTGSGTTCVVSMTSAKSVTVTFNSSGGTPTNYTLTTSKDGTGTGTVSAATGINCGATCNYDYVSGTQVTLTATPASGSSFAAWTGSGCSGTGTCIVDMTTARSVTATFNIIPPVYYTLTTSKDGTGTGTVTSAPTGINCGATCNYDYVSGTQVTLTATPAGGSTFAAWTGSGCSGTSTCVVNMTVARSVTATFNVTASSSFPVVQSTNTSTSPDNTENHTVSLPSGIQTGDLILVFFALDDSNNTIVWPSGWTEIALGDLGSTKLSVGYKIATSPGGTSISIATGVGNGQPSAHQTFRISGFTGTPQASTVASGNSTTPDSPSFSPTWGSKNTLWFAFNSRNMGSTRPTSLYPTNYTNGITVHVAPTGTDGATLASARRELVTATENPGTFTITGGTDAWLAVTVAVQGL